MEASTGLTTIDEADIEAHRDIAQMLITRMVILEEGGGGSTTALAGTGRRFVSTVSSAGARRTREVEFTKTVQGVGKGDPLMTIAQHTVLYRVRRGIQVALAIGKGGHNIKLAGKLTGFDIDVYRETDEVTDDVSLDEFRDEIDQWIIDEIKNIGCDTARSVLDIPVEDLVKRTDLEEETIREVVRILSQELEA